MLIDAIADYLQAQGLGTVATDLFVGFLPAQPDAATALYATGGPPPDLGRYTYPTFQVRTRGADPRAAYDRGMAVLTALHGLHDRTLGSSYLVDCVALQSSPVAIGRDSAGRYEYTLNVRAHAHKE